MNEEAKNIDIKKAGEYLTDASKTFFELIGIECEESVEIDEENLVVNLRLDCPDPGLLIGSRGRTINSIQLLLSHMASIKAGGKVRVSVDIADWRKKEADRLNMLAEHTLERAIETKEPQYLYNLSPFQRRIVHTYINETGKGTSRSEGEGKERYLIVEVK